MSIVGYARVSSVDQSLDVQLDKLKDCDKLFKEKRTGTSNKRLCLDTEKFWLLRMLDAPY